MENYLAEAMKSCLHDEAKKEFLENYSIFYVIINDEISFNKLNEISKIIGKDLNNIKSEEISDEDIKTYVDFYEQIFPNKLKLFKALSKINFLLNPVSLYFKDNYVFVEAHKSRILNKYSNRYFFRNNESDYSLDDLILIMKEISISIKWKLDDIHETYEALDKYKNDKLFGWSLGTTYLDKETDLNKEFMGVLAEEAFFIIFSSEIISILKNISNFK